MWGGLPHTLSPVSNSIGVNLHVKCVPCSKSTSLRFKLHRSKFTHCRFEALEFCFLVSNSIGVNLHVLNSNPRARWYCVSNSIGVNLHSMPSIERLRPLRVSNSIGVNLHNKAAQNVELANMSFKLHRSKFTLSYFEKVRERRKFQTPSE